MGNNDLYGVDAISQSDIWAVGSYDVANSTNTLSEHWNGTSWSVVPSPNSGTQFNELKAVTAFSTSDIWAVGDSLSGSFHQSLVEHWNGTSWQVVPSPNPGTGNNLLFGVAAISTNNVWSVGKYYSGSVGYSLVEHWNGTSWSVVASPNPGTTDNELDGVTTLSSSNVWAVGYFNSGVAGTDDQALTEHWNGTSWSVIPSPNVATLDYVRGVTAVSSSDIWAVGAYANSGSGFQSLVEHWNGTSWSAVSSPNPGTSDTEPIGVDAISSSDVWTVGGYNSGTVNGSLTEHWDGTSWSVVSSPSPGAGGNHLYGVTAVSSNDVWAVGIYSNQGINSTLVEHYSMAGCNTLTPTPAITNTPAATSTSLPTSTATDTPAPPNTPGPTATPQPTVCPNPFVDIYTNIFFHAINALYCRGDVNGTDSTHYSPSSTSTSAQFAKVVVLGFGLPMYTSTGGQDFSDVPPIYFAYGYIESGYHAGILNGFDTSTCTAYGVAFPCYLPNLPITRGQLTKLVVNAAGYPLYTPTSGQTFSDVPPSNVFYVSIETAHSKGVINGYPDHTFRPNSNIRRDEMAQIVYKGVITP